MEVYKIEMNSVCFTKILVKKCRCPRLKKGLSMTTTSWDLQRKTIEILSLYAAVKAWWVCISWDPSSNFFKPEVFCFKLSDAVSQFIIIVGSPWIMKLPMIVLSQPSMTYFPTLLAKRRSVKMVKLLQFESDEPSKRYSWNLVPRGSPPPASRSAGGRRGLHY